MNTNRMFVACLMASLIGTTTEKTTDQENKSVSDAITSTQAPALINQPGGGAAIPGQEKQSAQPAGPPISPATSTVGPEPPEYSPPPSPPSIVPQNGVNSIPLPTPEQFEQMRQLVTLTKLITDAAEEDARKEAAEKQKSATTFRQLLGITALLIVVFIGLAAWRGKKIFSRKQASQ